MDQFRPQRGNSLSDMVGVARGIVGNDPHAALRRMSDSGMTCTLPDGRVMPVSELARMAEGRSATQLLEALGIK